MVFALNMYRKYNISCTEFLHAIIFHNYYQWFMEMHLIFVCHKSRNIHKKQQIKQEIL